MSKNTSYSPTINISEKQRHVKLCIFIFILLPLFSLMKLAIKCMMFSNLIEPNFYFSLFKLKRRKINVIHRQ